MLDLIFGSRIYAFASWRHTVAIWEYMLHKDKISNETAAFWGMVREIAWLGNSLADRVDLLWLLIEATR